MKQIVFEALFHRKKKGPRRWKLKEKVSLIEETGECRNNRLDTTTMMDTNNGYSR